MAKSRMTIAKLEERLNKWTEGHQKRHNNEDQRLNQILESLKNHNDNHHGTRSGIKLTGIASAIAGVLAATALLLLRELSNWLPSITP